MWIGVWVCKQRQTGAGLALPVVWSQKGSPVGTVQLQGAAWSPADQVGVDSPAWAAADNQSQVGDGSPQEAADSQ